VTTTRATRRTPAAPRRPDDADANLGTASSSPFLPDTDHDTARAVCRPCGACNTQSLSFT
jgi:hypothetical protein